MNAGRLYALGWRVLARLPGAVGRVLFDVVAHAAWVLRGHGVRQLEQNLARLRPVASRRELRRLSRAGMRSYMRYFCEAFQMPGFTPAQIDARVRAIGADALRDELAKGRSVTLALGHTGNWDLAGAWSARRIGPVVAVAERLKPEELFQQFRAFREANGITVIPFEKGGGVFRTLLRFAREGGRMLPLLADRDLSRGGLEVDLAGHPARVAVGPAVLAVAAGVPVVPTLIHYERLSGVRRRAAGGPWGIVLDFRPPVEPPIGLSREETVSALTQAWVDVVGEAILAHPEDWHMLQKVFVEDLDPVRLAAQDGAGG